MRTSNNIHQEKELHFDFRVINGRAGSQRVKRKRHILH